MKRDPLLQLALNMLEAKEILCKDLLSPTAEKHFRKASTEVLLGMKSIIEEKIDDLSNGGNHTTTPHSKTKSVQKIDIKE